MTARSEPRVPSPVHRRLLNRIVILSAIAVPAISNGAPPQVEPQIVLRGASVVDVESGRVLAPRTISIGGGRVLAVETDGPDPAPASATVIDASGLFVMPGLWDAHAHLSYWGEDALDRLVGHGVTTIRELGGDPDEIEGWKAGVEAGDRIGPAMFWCGPFFEGPQGGDEYRWTVDSPAMARQLAAELLDRGVDFLKIQPRIGAAEVAVLVEVASERGSSVVGHVPEGLTAIEAADLGLRSIEHLSLFTRLSAEELEATIVALLEAGTWISPALFSVVAQVEAAGESRDESESVQRAYGVVRRLHESGVPMLVGSNFAFRDWPHRPGSALHGEMEVLVEAGIPTAEVLRMTTAGNASFLGVAAHEIAVTPGASADLLLLEANPLEDVGNVRRIAGVVLGGRYLDSDRLAALRNADD